MNHADALRKGIENLRECLSRLSRASLRIAGDLDLDTVLQETMDGESPAYVFSEPRVGYRRL